MTEDIQQLFEQLKGEMVEIIQQEIDLQVKESIRTALFEKIDESTERIVTAIEASTDRMIAPVVESMNTGFLQTHNLLSNVAGQMQTMNDTLGTVSSTLKEIAENTKK